VKHRQLESGTNIAEASSTCRNRPSREWALELTEVVESLGLLWRETRCRNTRGGKGSPSKPRRSPNATEVDVVVKIDYLRPTHHFGLEKIAMYLKRYHDVTVSKSGVWRILKRLDMNRLPTSQRYKTQSGAGSGTRSSGPATTSRST
jgi:hypothetical protein